MCAITFPFPRAGVCMRTLAYPSCNTDIFMLALAYPQARGDALFFLSLFFFLHILGIRRAEHVSVCIFLEHPN